MFENPRRGRQARNFTTNIPKFDLKSSSEQIIFQKLTLGAPEILDRISRSPVQSMKSPRYSSNFAIQF